MRNTPNGPLVGELVEASPRSDARAGLVALLVAAAPLAARAGWWWWNHGRRRTLTVSARQASEPAAIERTEIEMVRKTLGRWRIRVVDTRWSVPSAPVAPAATGYPAPSTGLLRAALRLSAVALQPGSQPRLSNRHEMARLMGPRSRREP